MLLSTDESEGEPGPSPATTVSTSSGFRLPRCNMLTRRLRVIDAVGLICLFFLFQFLFIRKNCDVGSGGDNCPGGDLIGAPSFFRQVPDCSVLFGDPFAPQPEYDRVPYGGSNCSSGGGWVYSWQLQNAFDPVNRAKIGCTNTETRYPCEDRIRNQINNLDDLGAAVQYVCEKVESDFVYKRELYNGVGIPTTLDTKTGTDAAEYYLQDILHCSMVPPPGSGGAWLQYSATGGEPSFVCNGKTEWFVTNVDEVLRDMIRIGITTAAATAGVMRGI